MATENELVTMNSNSKDDYSGELVKGNGYDIGKYECYKRWNLTKFIFYTIIIVLLTGLLVGILSNADRMGGSDDSSEPDTKSDHDCNDTIIIVPIVNETDYCSSDGLYEGPAVDATGFSWSYDDNTGRGPSVWSDYYPQCDCKSHQSPRDIDTIHTRLNTPNALCSDHTHLLQWDINSNYTDEWNGTFEVFHNEHTIQMKNINYINDSFIPIAYLNNIWQPVNSTLHSEFRLEQIHFHWGSGTDENSTGTGSPHTFDGKHYPLAIHFVHYSTDYDSLGEGFVDSLTNLIPNNKDRYILAVVGALYEIDPLNNSYNYALDQLLQSEVLNSNNSNQGFVEKINLTALLPADLSSFYYYPGSITTPPCMPIVRWHILSETLKINANQIEKFRSIAGETITWNSRPVHENTAPVYYCHSDFVYT